MKTKIILYIPLLLLFFTSCTSNRINITDSQIYKIEQEYKKDLEKYEIKHGSFYDVLIMEYGVLPSHILGRCRTDIVFGIKIRTLTLKKDINDEFLIKYIYYHEMGHCNFDLPHDDVGFKLMNTEISKEKVEIYKNNWDYLKHTYFTKVKKQY